MKILKLIAKKLASRFSRIWERAGEINYETYLREREINEARERARIRLMYYGRGSWL